MESATHLPPHQHAVKDKHDIIDWEHLPAGECDMNYRLEDKGSSASVFGTAILPFVAAMVAATLFVLLAIWPQPWSTMLGSSQRVFFVALISASFVLLRNRSYAGSVSAGLTIGGILLACSLLSIATGGLSLPGRLTLLLVVTLVSLIWVADNWATTNAWWCTANPRVQRRTMTAYREAWQSRWLDDTPDGLQPVVAHCLRQYRLGPLWLGGALCGGAMLGLLTTSVIDTRLIVIPVLIQITIVLLFVAALRLTGTRAACWKTLLATFQHHTTYGSPVRQPPWVLELPTGPAWQRKSQAPLATGLVAFMVVATASRESLPDDMNPFLVWILCCSAACIAPLWVASSLVIAAGPIVLGYHQTLEAPGSIEQQPKRSQWDGYVARLHESRNPLERRSVWIGCQLKHGYPILVDRSLYFEHAHVVGSAGSGKTALSLSSDLAQLIRNNSGEDRAGGIVIIDSKGDNSLLHAAREEARAAGRTFKWFTNLPHRETYVFNPLLQMGSSGLSLSETIGVITQSLNLYHGEEYGRGYFGAASRALLQAAYQTSFTFGGAKAARPPIESFSDLEEALRDACDDPQEFQAAKQLLYVVASLSEFQQLNLSTGERANESILSSAIHLPSLIEKGEVAYFYLVGAMDLSSVGHLARLVLYSTLTAAIDFKSRTGQPAGVHIFADEAQCLISKNIQPVLEQARSFGVGCIFAHQNLSQLNTPGGVDLRELVLANTVVKRYHAARDPDTQKYLAAACGRSSYYDLSWDQFKRRVVQDGQVGPRFACTGADKVMRMSVQQRVGDRVEIEEIADMNRRLDQSVAFIERSEGLTQYNGGFIMRSDWPVDKATFARRDSAPWPSEPSEMLASGQASPLIRSTTHPEIDLDATDLDERLRRVQRELFGNADSDDSATNDPEDDPKTENDPADDPESDPK